MQFNETRDQTKEMDHLIDGETGQGVQDSDFGTAVAFGGGRRRQLVEQQRQQDMRPPARGLDVVHQPPQDAGLRTAPQAAAQQQEGRVRQPRRAFAERRSRFLIW